MEPIKDPKGQKSKDAKASAPQDSIKTPDATAKPDATAVSDEQAKADAIKAQKRIETTQKLAKLRAELAEAKADAKKWELDPNDPESVEYHEYKNAKVPTWYTMKLDRIKLIEDEITETITSVMTPEEKAYKLQLIQLEKDIEAASLAVTLKNKELADLKAKILAEYPEFFGTSAKVAKAPKAEGATREKSDGEIKPFMGTLLPLEQAKEEVKRLHESGITRETDIIRAMYGEGFTISGSAAASNPTTKQNPRGQVHAIREKFGYC